MNKIAFLVLGALLIAVPVISGCQATAPSSAPYPEKLINWIIPATPGGNVDGVPRAVAPVLSSFLPGKQGIVLENISPPVTTKGLTVLNQSAPDGYTVAGMSPDGATIIQLTEPVSWDLRKFTYFGTMTRSPKLLVRRNEFAYSTIKDIVAAKAKVRFTTIPGTFQLFSTLVAKETGMDATYVTGYKGTGEIILGLIRGDGDLAVVNVPSVVDYLKEGKLKAVFTMTDERVLSDVPSAKETGFAGLANLSEYASSTIVFFGPPGVPDNVVNVLSDGLKKALAEKGVLDWAEKAKLDIYWKSPQDTAKAVRTGFDVFSQYIDYLK